MKTTLRVMGLAVATGILSTALAAETSSASRYDSAIASKVTQQLAAKKQFQKIQVTVEDGIVTLTGNVDLYQQKLDAARKVRKLQTVQGVRNLIEVGGQSIPDAQLTAELDRKLYYDRMGYDIAFNYVTATVNDGVVTLNGETRDQFDCDSALALVDNTAGVKDVVNNLKVDPASIFDDQIRVRTLQAIYRDSSLQRYAIDPARPIRILVDNGHVTLYGTVGTAMDKQIAGIRANQVFGAFSVQNNLEVAKKS